MPVKRNLRRGGSRAPSFLPTLRDKFLLGDNISLSASSATDSSDGSHSDEDDEDDDDQEGASISIWKADKRRRANRHPAQLKHSSSGDESLWHLEWVSDDSLTGQSAVRENSARSRKSMHSTFQSSSESSYESIDSDEDINLIMVDSSSSGMSYDSMDTDTDSDDFVMYDALISASQASYKTPFYPRSLSKQNPSDVYDGLSRPNTEGKAVRPIDLLSSKVNDNSAVVDGREHITALGPDLHSHGRKGPEKKDRTTRPVMGKFKHSSSPKAVVDGKSPVPAKLPKWLKNRHPKKQHRKASFCVWTDGPHTLTQQKQTRNTFASSPRYGNATLISIDEILDLDTTAKKTMASPKMESNDGHSKVHSVGQASRWERIPIGAFKRAQGIDANEPSAIWPASTDSIISHDTLPKQNGFLSSMLCVTKRRKGADALASPMLVPFDSRNIAKSQRRDRASSQRRLRRQASQISERDRRTFDTGSKLPSAGLSYNVSPLFAEQYLQNISPSFPPLDDGPLET